ncbi:hypothetical protein GYB59_02160 [bacterium]|nr:hypothetical protein [bacterium]
MGKYHANKEISKAIEFAIKNGWRYEKSAGHPNGRLFCPGKARGTCIRSVWSTPKNPQAHARDLIRYVKKCQHGKD